MNIIFEDGVIKTPNLEFEENCGGIGNVYFNALKKYNDRVAVINTRTDEYYTFGDLLKKTTTAAIALQERGIKKQDLIAICSNRENLNANIPILAGQFLGCITFSIDPAITVDECSELLVQTPPRILFVIEEAKHLIQTTLEKCNIQADLVIFGQEFEENFLKLEKFNDSFKPIFIDNLQETCVMHFSSGSTGTPKPICMSHYLFLAVVNTPGFSTRNLLQKELFANHPIGPVGLRHVNWYWCSTSFELMIFILSGGCILLRDSFDSKTIWNLIEKYHITELFLTPLQCMELSKCEKPEQCDISSLYRIPTGGYVLPTDNIYALRKLFPDVFILQIYGMTECGGITSFEPNIPEHRSLLLEKPSSCGLPINGLYYKVINIDTGEKCGPNQPGELHLKGKKLFNGFYNKDASRSFDTEGYFKTGDLVSFDEDFCFYILDRIKAIIAYKDWVIYPSYIEKVLLTHPSIDNAMVIGIPHKIDVERLMGVVMLNEDAPKVTEEELVQYVEERVEDHKRIRGGVKFVKYFPTTITGKVSRFKVKEMVLNNSFQEK